MLEGLIVFLVGLNGYFVYSAISTDTPVTSGAAGKRKPDTDRQLIQVEVLNGCGVKGIGQQVGTYLRSQGFDVVFIDNAENFDFPETVVLDRRAGKAISAASQSVGESLGTQHVIMQRNEDRLVDATVIVGHDYRQLRSFEE